MSNHIESGRIFIKEVFAWWYRVPVYQRPYVWGTDQVNDLLEDVAHASATNRMRSTSLEQSSCKRAVLQTMMEPSTKKTICLMVNSD